MTEPKGINEYNISEDKVTSLFHEDLNQTVSNINIATNAIFGNEPNSFQILSGFSDNGDGTFSGGYVVMNGIIHLLNDNISSGYYIEPSLVRNTTRLTKDSVLLEVYTMYLASASPTPTGFPQINQANINVYRGSVTNLMLKRESVTSSKLSTTDFILPNVANGIGATGINSCNFGTDGQATGDDSSNFGYGGQATGVSSCNFGTDGQATADGSSNFGYGGQATAVSSSNFGFNGQATGLNSSNFGYGGLATGISSSNFGVNGQATGLNSSNFGVGGQATGLNSSNFGTYGQATADNSSNFGVSGEATGTNSSNFGRSGQATAVSSSNFGVIGQATGVNSSNFGVLGKATGLNSSNFGYNGQATGISSSNFGAGGQAIGLDSSNFGISGEATGLSSSNFGAGGLATASASSNFGVSGRATGTNSSNFGRSGQATGLNSSNFGAYGAALSANQINLGDSNITLFTCKVALTVTSDKRDKIDVKSLEEEKAVEILSKLNTVTYKSNNRNVYYFEKEEKNKKNIVVKNSENEDIIEEIEETILVRENTRCQKGNVLYYDKEAHAKGEKKLEKTYIGLIAQELEAVLEEVTGDKRFGDLVNDSSDNGEIEKEHSEMGIVYQNLIPLLILGFQKQQKEIESLKKIIEKK